MNVDFFRIHMPEGEGTFEDALRRIKKMKLEKRVKPTAAGLARLENLSAQREVVEPGQDPVAVRHLGELTRMRMSDLASVVARDKPADDLPIEDTEGIGEHNVFLYDFATQILVYQSNGAGFRLPRFLNYVSAAALVDGVIDFEAVIPQDVLKVISRMKRPMKMDVGIGQGVQPTLVGGDNVPMQAMFDAQNAFLRDADKATRPSVRMHIGISGKMEYLKPNIVRDTAKKLFGRRAANPEYVPILKVTGYIDDDATRQKEFNLLTPRLRDRVKIPTYEGRRIPYSTRKSCIKSAWEKRADEMAKLYVPAKKAKA
ncbi:MAG: DUF6731 family protein [Planctomycetota bacterium]